MVVCIHAVFEEAVSQVYGNCIKNCVREKKPILPFIDNSIVIWTIIIQRHSLILLRYWGDHRDRHVERSRVRRTKVCTFCMCIHPNKPRVPSLVCNPAWSATAFPPQIFSRYLSSNMAETHAECFILVLGKHKVGRREDPRHQDRSVGKLPSLVATVKQNKVPELEKNKSTFEHKSFHMDSLCEASNMNRIHQLWNLVCVFYKQKKSTSCTKISLSQAYDVRLPSRRNRKQSNNSPEPKPQYSKVAGASTIICR